MTEIAAGVFVYAGPYELATPQNLDAISNAGFVIGRDGVAVIDSSGSFLAGRRLLAAIRQKTDLPIRYVIDTHVHLDEEAFRPDRDDVVARAAAAGVANMITIGISATTGRAAVEIAQSCPAVYAAVAIQPNYVSQAAPGDWDVIRELATQPKAEEDELAGIYVKRGLDSDLGIMDLNGAVQVVT